jgi:hypothetical protein
MNIAAIKIGVSVRIYNQEHIWHNEFGIVREIGPVFSIIELSNQLVQLPNHWLRVEDRKVDND